MAVISVHSKDEIERFLRRNTYLHIYSIGDLDDFFWGNTVWYALKDGGEIRQIVLNYTALEMPVFLAFTEEQDEMSVFLRSLIPLLPRKFYAQLSEGLRGSLAADYSIDCHGTYYKMGLRDMSQLGSVDTSGVERLSQEDLDEITALYRASYPGNWFDARMLDTGHYYGVRMGNALVGIAGVHIYSEKYRVAALGNVTTHPDHRGQGIATAACAKLCAELSATVDHIGLNVRADNQIAVSTYEKLGFARTATYEECSVGDKA